jgi:hypothetical protein
MYSIYKLFFKSAVSKLELTKQLINLAVKFNEEKYKLKTETDKYELKEKELRQIKSNDKNFLSLCEREIKLGQDYIDKIVKQMREYSKLANSLIQKRDKVTENYIPFT